MKRYVIHGPKVLLHSRGKPHQVSATKHSAWRFLAQERAELVAIELSARCSLPLSVIEVD